MASIGGPLAVDFFLITSACFAIYQLLPPLEGSTKGPAASTQPSCGRVVLRYWQRRALRLLPAYAATNLPIAVGLGSAPHAAPFRNFAFGNCPAGLWRNALFINNNDVTQACGEPARGVHVCAMPCGGKGGPSRGGLRSLACRPLPPAPQPLPTSAAPPGAGLYLWSLTLQVQVFIAVPLLLWALRPRTAGFRARLAVALAAAVLGGTAWRMWRVASTQHLLHLPLGDLTQRSEAAAYWSLLDATYFPTGTRVAELALGAALGLLLRSHAAVSWMLRR